jgi:hypothetical protein
MNSMTEGALSEWSPEQPTIAQSLIAEDVPFCYMQTSDGELMDLTRFCGNRIRQQQPASPDNPTAIVPSTPAIVVPTSPVPKGSACFVFDEQGQPCVSSR